MVEAQQVWNQLMQIFHRWLRGSLKMQSDLCCSSWFSASDVKLNKQTHGMHIIIQERPLTLAQLDDSSDNDDNEGCHLSIGENVLYARAPLYIGRVDECQQA